MRNVCAKMVPKELAEEQTQRRVTICQDLLERQDDILGLCYYRWWNTGLPIRSWNEAAKCTMEDCQFPTTKNVPSVQIKSQNNVADFIDIRGIVHYEFVPTGQTINKVYYWKYWKGCVRKLRRKRPESFANNSWILQHDNAPAHTALSVREFLATKQKTVLEHPAYSPYLAPSEFFLFPKIEEILKGRHLMHWWHQE